MFYHAQSVKGKRSVIALNYARQTRRKSSSNLCDWLRPTAVTDSGGSSPQYLGRGTRPQGERGSASLQRGSGPEPSAGSRDRAPGQGGRSPREAEALLVFGHSMKAANLLTFLKFENADKSDICVICAKLIGSHGTGEGSWSKTGGLCPRAPT